MALQFCIFHALSFEINLFFDRTCPLKKGLKSRENTQGLMHTLGVC